MSIPSIIAHLHPGISKGAYIRALCELRGVKTSDLAAKAPCSNRMLYAVIEGTRSSRTVDQYLSAALEIPQETMEKLNGKS